MTLSSIDRAIAAQLNPLASYALAVFRIMFALLLVCHGTTALFGFLLETPRGSASGPIGTPV